VAVRVGIIGFANIRYMPYLRYYTEVLDKNAIEYELIYWDRRGLSEKIHCRTHVMRMRLDDATPKARKIIPMLRFGQFAKKVIQQREYDFLIFLAPIPAVILCRFLSARYVNRYVVDIRDYSLEHNPVYFAALRKVLGNAALRVISSPAFTQFLPVANYVLCHNISVPNGERKSIPRAKTANKPIQVSYIGAIAYFEEVKKFILAIANDARFSFALYGSGMDEGRLEDFCRTAQIKNVHFYGAYDPAGLSHIYTVTDIVFNAYGNDTPNVRCLLSNKLYNAAWHQLPIIVTPQTAMAAAAGYMGFQVDYANVGVADALHKWYNELDWDKVHDVATDLLNAAMADNNTFGQKLVKALGAGGG